ncbi:Carboxylic ester hydrolase [Mycena sanguinolenta]|uniref:Carboxylic ester hydrolase n=1 Tax=Mycena sanguinolenta TaxID=230812 RepID=A0A8H7D4W4_9AGAR|nr:Carboxylic ester hydrolase [Mycena sanguinolenta]
MATLEHLSQLDTLTSLTALLPEEPLLPGASLPFIALKRLDIMYDVEPVTDFFERCSGTPLKDVSIKLITCPTRAAIDRLHAALRDGCSHSSLLSLVIDINENYPPEPATDLMTIHSLRPLFCFANLTCVCITSLGFDMDDQGMDELACAWPQLRILKLRFARMNYPTELGPRFSLRSLSTLAKHCRKLTELFFALNATFVPEPDPDVVPQLVLRDFYVGRSPITAPSLPVAQFISAIFPNMVEIQTCSFNNDDFQLQLPPEIIARHRLWTEVAAQIPILTATREAEPL